MRYRATRYGGYLGHRDKRYIDAIHWRCKRRFAEIGVIWKERIEGPQMFIGEIIIATLGVRSLVVVPLVPLVVSQILAPPVWLSPREWADTRPLA
jgi:hypothetical protein